VTVLICSVCGETVVARSRFEAEGECPECGGGEGCLVEQDAYDGEVREIACENCGFTTDSAVFDAITRKRTTVDDPCPICEETLVPAGRARSARDVPEYRMVRAAASKLRRAHSDSIPVDVVTVAAAVGLDVVLGPFRHDGMLIDMRLEVPTSDPAVVQRFVIAHEIGHYELRHTGERHKIEPEANAFASELLVPAADLKVAVGAGLDVPELASRFQVSRQALVYALMSHKLVASVRPR
jgi:DNA-directed RNA polymerase subunit RPC12/RpoP